MLRSATISITAGTRENYQTDHLGSVRTTIDQNGIVIGYDDYYPFGLAMNRRSSNLGTPNDLNKFTGHERDQEGGINLDYMLARNYDPEIGRFLSVDPLHSKRSWLSPYNYVQNNPLIRIDPTGLIDWVATMYGGLTMAGGVVQIAAGIALTPVILGGSSALIVSGTMTTGLGMGQVAVGLAETGQDIPSGALELVGMASGNETARSIGKGADAVINMTTTGVLGVPIKNIKPGMSTIDVVIDGYKNIGKTSYDIVTKNLKAGAQSRTEALARQAVSTVNAIENATDVGGTISDGKVIYDEVKKD